MASYQISIKDSTSARNWLAMVEGINQDYMTAMQEAEQVLKHVNDVMEGTIVDEIVALSDKLLTAGKTIFDGISTISEEVNGIIDAVSGAVDSAKNLFSSAVNAIFN